MSTCPFHQSNQLDPLASHAIQLAAEGLGPVSRMIRESILQTEISNPDLPAIHSAEAAKFAAMAQRIVPPELAADSIQRIFNPYPVVSIMDESNINKSFMSIVERTRGLPGVKPPNDKFEICDTYNYLKLCSRDPRLLLSCFYLSVGMLSVVKMLTNHVDDPRIRQDMSDFGSQFNASNLLISLPMAISGSLFKLKGANANADQINYEVLNDALTNLHHKGQFQISARNPSNNEIVSFKCPMQGYLFNLLTKHRVMETIVESIIRAENDPTDLDLLRTKISEGQTDKFTRKDMLLLVHKHNSDNIRNMAGMLASMIRV